MRHFFQRSNAHRHFANRKSIGAGDLAGLEHHIAQGCGAAGQHHAFGQFVVTQCLTLVRAHLDVARDFQTFAGTAGTVFAAVWQADSLAYARRQNRFVLVHAERTATGLH